MSPERRPAGTTLVELIVALALMTVLSLALFSMRSTAVRDDDRQERRQAYHHDLLLMKARLRRDLRSAHVLHRGGPDEWEMLIWRDDAEGWPVTERIRWWRHAGKAVVERMGADGTRRWSFERHVKGEDFVFTIDP